jgi:hypothetical protein
MVNLTWQYVFTFCLEHLYKSNLSVIGVRSSEAEVTIKDKKLKTQINGKFNDVSSDDVSK